MGSEARQEHGTLLHLPMLPWEACKAGLASWQCSARCLQINKIRQRESRALKPQGRSRAAHSGVLAGSELRHRTGKLNREVIKHQRCRSLQHRPAAKLLRCAAAAARTRPTGRSSAVCRSWLSSHERAGQEEILPILLGGPGV